ncbi:MAG TPA: hypothetical protein VHM91_07435 [Verrucomicrobiales bacterium]|nr:hypothetical protein [Verrucomicrobiales bacterium]
MKRVLSVRSLTGGVLLLTGMVLCAMSGGNGSGFSNAMLCLIAGACLVSPGRRMIRNLVGAALLTMFWMMAGSAGGAGGLLMAMSVLILSAILFSETLSHLFAKPFTAVIDGIYFGNNSREAPPLTLRLARWYRQNLRFEEAQQECERQLEYHPHSLELWCELIHGARESGDGKKMDVYLKKARHRLDAEGCRQLDFEFQRYFLGAGE